MGLIGLLLAALLTAGGLGLIAIALEPRRATEPSTGFEVAPARNLAAARSWMSELKLFQQVDEFGETARVAMGRPMAKMLVEAGIRMRTSELVLISIPCALVAAFLAWLAVGLNPLVVVAAAAGAIIPREVVVRMAGARARKIESELPAALLLIADTLRAGRSLGAAIEQVAHSARPPIGDEFGRAARQIAMGSAPEEAIAAMADRTGVRDLELLGAAISVVRVSGGDLPRLLNSMAAVARSRRALAGQMRAMTAQARATSLVLSLLPLIVGAICYVAAPEYFRPMLHSVVGWAMLIVAGMLVATGLLIMRSIIARQMR